jgi:hypothetical protein
MRQAGTRFHQNRGCHVNILGRLTGQQFPGTPAHGQACQPDALPLTRQANNDVVDLHAVNRGHCLRITVTIFLLLFVRVAAAQIISASLPRPIDKQQRYLFYLHGGAVTVLGDNAINQGAPEWGPYEYSNILDTLRKRGFNVVSERRFEHITDDYYAARLGRQVDSLLKAGVPVDNIVIVSASAGWSISFRVSAQLRNQRLRFVKIGGCREYNLKEVEGIELYGDFLSIIEKSDPRGTCKDLFEPQKHVSGFKEVVLNTGLNHGFFYTGRREWIDPIMEWLH